MITAVIITYHESEHIVECINSVLGICNEVVIVDAESTDDTVDLARACGERIKIHVKRWEGYGAARNYGAQVAQHNWILSMDADERLTQELKDTLASTKLEDQDIYHIKRHNVYAGVTMKYGMLQPEWKERLYNRRMTQWDNRIVHERLSYTNGDLTVKRLKGSLIHLAYKDQEDLLERLNHYAELTAMSWHQRRYNPNPLLRFFGPHFHFFKAHILKKGLLQRPYGLETSKAAYYYNHQKYRHLNNLKLDTK